jgi:hypothetical protein
MSEPTDFEAILRTHMDGYFSLFACGAEGAPSEADIAAFEASIGFALPSEFREFSKSPRNKAASGIQFFRHSNSLHSGTVEDLADRTVEAGGAPIYRPNTPIAVSRRLCCASHTNAHAGWRREHLRGLITRALFYGR